MKGLENANRTSKGRGIHPLIVMCAVLIASLFMSTIPIAWATSEAAPLNQTIPPPSPTPLPPEKKKELPGATPTPSLGIPGVPVDVRLGPGDGMFHLSLVSAGCIQINVSGMPAQLLFQVTPLDPGALAAPPPECRRTTAAYSVKVWDTRIGQETFSVAPDYIHTICYNDADLAAANGDPNRFVIARYDEATQTWVKLEPSIVDVPNRHVVGTTDQTGWWALLACEAAAPMLLPETGVSSSEQHFPVLAVLSILSITGGIWLFRRARRFVRFPDAQR
ncbi:MAG: LPXTG cell wall anchor domain-containing protein [Anaerolineae bacterium]